MVEFIGNIDNLLPYNRKQYILLKKWYGVSFQLEGGYDGKKIQLKDFTKKYEPFFKNLIIKFDKGSSWIINHDCLDQEWFPNDENNLVSLRTLFKKNNIPNTFKGAMIFMKDDLFKYAKDLITYPLSVINKENSLYSNLDISNSELQIVIKITGHSSIDLLSTNKEFLRKIVNDNFSKDFIIKEYRGTKLNVSNQ